jgi:two-component system, LytTR family, response regulator
MLSKIKTIIIDDEIGSREVLKIKLKSGFPDIEISGEAENIIDAFNLCNSLRPQLVFLDVKLQDGNAFDLLKKFESVDFEIILATGYNDFGLEAIKADVVDYIIKPYKTQELACAVKKALDRIEYKSFHKQYHNSLHHNGIAELKESTKINIHTSNGQKIIDASELLRCQGWEKYTYFFLINGEKHLTVYNIGKYIEKLEALGFIHCHKSHIVNKDMIKGYEEGYIILKNDTRVPLARRRKSAFNELMKNL